MILRSLPLLALLALVSACATQSKSTEMASLRAELQRMDDQKAAGLFYVAKIDPLTRLRRLEGRPDPLQLVVDLDYGSPPDLPAVSVRLRRREGETEPFDLIDPESITGDAAHHFALVLENHQGKTWTSYGSGHTDADTRIGWVDVLHRAPGDESESTEGKGPIALPWVEFTPPPPPGSYTVTVRYFPSRKGAKDHEPNDLVISSSPASVPVLIPRSTPTLSALTNLRRSQGRPDPLDLKVLANHSPTSGMPDVHVRLQHRTGEPGFFRLDSFEADAMANYQVVLTNDAGVAWTSSADRVLFMGGYQELYFQPGFAYAGFRLQGRMPPPLGYSAQPDEWLQLNGHHFEESPPPGRYMLSVRFQEEGRTATIESEPIPITLKPSRL